MITVCGGCGRGAQILESLTPCQDGQRARSPRRFDAGVSLTSHGLGLEARRTTPATANQPESTLR